MLDVPAGTVLAASCQCSGTTLPDSVVGLYFTAVSVIIVYHLFALQTWSTTVESLGRVAAEVERRTVAEDVERRDLVDELNEARANYPYLQVVILGLSVSALSALALSASIESGLPFLYGGTPTVIMFAVFVGSTVASFVQGRRRLTALRRLLAPKEAPRQMSR